MRNWSDRQSSAVKHGMSDLDERQWEGRREREAETEGEKERQRKGETDRGREGEREENEASDDRLK